MKRPLGIIGLAYLFALIVFTYVSKEAAFIMIVLSVFTLIITIFIKKNWQVRTISVCCIVLIIGALIMNVATVVYKQPVHKLNGKQMQINAILVGKPTKTKTGYMYTVQTKSTNYKGSPPNFKIMLSTSEKINADYYDEISCTIKLYNSKNQTMDKYYSAKGIYIFGNIISDIRVINDKKSLMFYPLMLSDLLSQKISDKLPNLQSSFCSAVLLGNKANLDSTVKNAFNVTGTGHIIVVSGLHLTIIANFFYYMIFAISKKRKISAMLSIISVLCFMAITGFAPSVVRAGIMIIILMSGRLFNRMQDSITSLGIAAIILTVGNPFAAGDIGLLLSFFATMGIVILNPTLSEYLLKKFSVNSIVHFAVDFILASFSITICAVIFMFPITLFTFGEVSPYFLLSNLLIVWAVGPLLVFSLFTAVFAFIPFLEFLSYGCGLIAGILSNYIIKIATMISKFPFATVSVDYIFIYVWFITTVVLIVIYLIFKISKKHIKTILAISTAVFLIGGSIHFYLEKNSMNMYFLNSEYGIIAVLENRGKLAVISAYGRYNPDTKVTEYIESIGEKIEYISANTQAKYWYDFSKDIAKKFDVNTLLLYDNDSKFDYSNYVKKTVKITDVFNYNLWDNITITSHKTNESIWIQIKQGANTVVICPTDGTMYNAKNVYKTSTLCVVNELPEGYENIQTSTFVVSTNAAKIDKTVNSLERINHNVYSVNSILKITLTNGMVQVSNEASIPNLKE